MNTEDRRARISEIEEEVADLAALYLGCPSADQREPIWDTIRLRLAEARRHREYVKKYKDFCEILDLKAIARDQGAGPELMQELMDLQYEVMER